MSFIKIHREIMESQVWCHQGILKFWIWLLLKANFKDSFASIKISNGFKSVEVKRGQLLFGRNKAEYELDIDGSTLYKWLLKLEQWGQLNIQSNSHYTLITILKYSEYQEMVTATEQPSNNQVTATEQPSNTYKNPKEGKESKEYNIPTPEEFLSYCKTIKEINYPSLEFSLKAKYNTWVADGWKDGNKKPIKNWKTKIVNVIPFLKPMQIEKTDVRPYGAKTFGV